MTLPPGDDDPPPPKKLRCEFCECSLSASGEVLRLSEKARSWRDSDGESDKLRKQVTGLESTIADLKEQLSKATKPAPAAARESEYLI